MRGSFGALALVLGALGPSQAVEGHLHFDLDRPGFWLAARKEFPGLKIPSMACGRPIASMYCWAELSDAVRVQFAESYRSNEEIEHFHAGGNGVVYEASVTLKLGAVTASDSAAFTLYCAAFASAGEIETDAVRAVSMIAQGLVSASESLEDGLGDVKYKNAAGYVIVQFTPGDSARCIITRQGF